MDGRDVLRWSAGSTHNGPNRNDFLALTPSLCQNICCFMSGPRMTMVNGVVGFGAARPYNGASNPQLGQGGIVPGDIVVTGSRWHNDQSFSYRYRAFDPYGSGYADFVENYDFLSVAVAESDVLAGVTADYSHLGGPVSEQLQEAFEAMKAQIEAILSNLNHLNPSAHFRVSYTDEGGTVRNGRIRVSELIMWLSRIDFEFYPAGHNFNNGGDGGVATRRQSIFRSGDVTLRVDESSFRGWAASPGTATWYLIHEIVHATSFGDTLLRRYGNGLRLEQLINGFARDIANTIAPAHAAAVSAYVNTPPSAAYADYRPAADANATFVTPTT